MLFSFHSCSTSLQCQTWFQSTLAAPGYEQNTQQVNAHCDNSFFLFNVKPHQILSDDRRKVNGAAVTIGLFPIEWVCPSFIHAYMM